MKQQLRKPENWQDFETLCKKLWGEIWECAEIKKNGRSGQAQYGVDIFGMPKSEKEYYGIQCKGKDDYTNAQLSPEEIDNEILKALTFKPALKKFYFATTANKDAKIEEYIRLKDIDSRAESLFEIHLFSWEDIVELIDDNKKTHDWYVKNINFVTRHQVQFLFQNDSSYLQCEPVFKKVTIRHFDNSLLSVALEKMFNTPSYRFGMMGLYGDPKEEFIKSVTEGVREEAEEKFNNPQPVRHNMSMMPMGSYNTYNKSVCVFRLCLKNTGSEVLEKYKINLRIEGAIAADTVDKQRYMMDTFAYKYDTRFYSESKHEATIKPSDDYLVQNDSICFDSICFKTNPKESQVKIHWQLVSQDFDDAGELVIDIQPKFELSEEPIFVEYPAKQVDELVIRNKYEYKNTDFHGNIEH